VIRRPGGRQAPAARTVRPAALRPGARPGGGVRRTRPVRRASAGLTPVRAGALLAILAGSAAIYGLASSDAFAATQTTVTGTTWTSEERILETLAIPEGTNVFTIRTAELEQNVMTIPAVKDVTVSVALPDEVRVAVTERVALLTWKVGDRRFLADGDGRLFAELGTDASDAASDLPVIDDARIASTTLGVGSVLDPVTLDAALRLGSLTPANVGTAARSLVLRVDDTDGFTMQTRPASWTAVFGFYTPTLRTTELIPGQVRLLRSILAGQEDTIARVILADDRSGTKIPRETPAPTRTPRPTKSPAPTRTPRPTRTPGPTPTPAPTASRAP
jgi:cell division septal protein FtsQ